MNNTIPKIETISWKVLVGNRFNRSLDPAMLTKDGCTKLIRIRRIGDVSKRAFNVVYDREYILGYIGRFLCKSLFVLGKQGVIDLVDAAWDAYYNNPQQVQPQGMSQETGNGSCQ